MTKRPSRVLRGLEITLWVLGLSALAVALGATVNRWSWQQEQERALARLAAASQLAPREGAAVPQRALEPAVRAFEDSAGAEAIALETIGPPAPPVEEDAVVETTAASSARGGPPAASEDSIELAPGILGRIEIPRLGLDAIVREGDDEATLGRAVGFIPGTARPGEGGNTALAGHRDTFFRSLRRIEEGDRIRLVVPPETFEYRVAETRIVEPDELSVLDSRGTEELTLVTCYPFRWIGPAPDRFVVKATRIP